MKAQLQKILNNFITTMSDEGQTLDELLSLLIKGNESDKELAMYIMSDETKDGGDDYLTDYQCIEMIASTYELEW